MNSFAILATFNKIEEPSLSSFGWKYTHNEGKEGRKGQNDPLWNESDSSFFINLDSTIDIFPNHIIIDTTN